MMNTNAYIAHKLKGSSNQTSLQQQHSSAVLNAKKPRLSQQTGTTSKQPHAVDIACTSKITCKFTVLELSHLAQLCQDILKIIRLRLI